MVPQEVERVIQGVADQMAGEIQRSLDFYAATAADANFTKVYLSGGTAQIPALFKTIEAARRRAGRDPEPLQEHRDRQPQVRPGRHHGRGALAAVAVGLALRRPGDK